MASFKALCLAGVASLVATVGANAADLLPPPAPIYAPPPPAPVAFGGGWYIRGDTGVGIADLERRNSTYTGNVPGIRYDATDLDDSALVDVGVGYRVNQFFRVDATADYHGAAHYSGTESYACTGGNCGIRVPRGIDYYSGSVRSVNGLVNGYLSAGNWYGFSPFVGAGVGVAYVGFGRVTDQGFGGSVGGFGYSQNRWTTNFAWAVMAGVDFAVTQNLNLEIGYRYLDNGTIASGTIGCLNARASSCHNEVQHFRLAYNDIRVGFRYAFADTVPAFAPAVPLIRKY